MNVCVEIMTTDLNLLTVAESENVQSVSLQHS